MVKKKGKRKKILTNEDMISMTKRKSQRLWKKTKEKDLN